MRYQQNLLTATTRRHRSQRGQTVIMVVVALGIAFLAVLGFVVDFGNLWFHRQSAQKVADAACTAAVMDMLQCAGQQLGFIVHSSSIHNRFILLQQYPVTRLIACSEIWQRKSTADSISKSPEACLQGRMYSVLG